MKISISILLVFLNLACLLGQDVTPIGFLRFDLALRGDLEALGGRTVGLHLWHRVLVSSVLVGTGGFEPPTSTVSR